MEKQTPKEILDKNFNINNHLPISKYRSDVEVVMDCMIEYTAQETSKMYSAEEVREISIRIIEECMELAYVQLPGHPHLHGTKNVYLPLINIDKYLTK